MKYRIAYCQRCNTEFEDILNKYGEKCICGNDLELAWKVIERDFSCIKLTGQNISILKQKEEDNMSRIVCLEIDGIDELCKD